MHKLNVKAIFLIKSIIINYKKKYEYKINISFNILIGKCTDKYNKFSNQMYIIFAIDI